MARGDPLSALDTSFVHLLGREVELLYPMVPLAADQTLGIALVSDNGQLNFRLDADWDRVGDLDELAGDLREAIAELAALAGLPSPPRRRRRDAQPARVPA